MKRIAFLILITVSILSMAFFVSCGNNKDNENADNNISVTEPDNIDLEGSDFENPAYEKETEGATITKKDGKSQEDFYGNWEAKSDYAEYLYGNIFLSIKKDGTWTGNITDDNYNGTWSFNNGTMTLSSEVINCNLFFDKDGTLLFQDHDDMEIYLVLTPGPK